jgi:hypothetical protein
MKITWLRQVWDEDAFTAACGGGAAAKKKAAPKKAAPAPKKAPAKSWFTSVPLFFSVRCCVINWCF